MFVTISKYPKGANLEASAYLKDSIKNKCPIEAKKPMAKPTQLPRTEPIKVIPA